MTKRTYSDSTPEVDYYYDNQSLPATKPPNFMASYSMGRLIAVTYGGVSSSAGSYQGYDQLGRVTSSYQQTDSINYGFGYGYNLASEMTSETYPSGRQVITEHDSAGRAAGIRAALVYYAGATASDATNRIQYAAHGAVSLMMLGNGKWEHTNFNNRLQPTQIGLGNSAPDSSLLKLDYGYGATTNNGNVLSQTITAPKASGGNLVLTQTYTYDALNRLLSASENGSPSWVQNYDYDRWGNRAVNPSSTLIPNPALTPTSLNNFSTTTNRITLSGFAYDAAGNMKNDPTTTPNPPNGMVYDGENRQLSYTKANAVTSYFYDGDGHRVKKVAGSITTFFVYNAMGQLTAEYTNDTTPQVGGGGTSYLTTDHLGSTRVVTSGADFSGNVTIKARYDYLPFGEEIPSNIGARSGVTGYGGADSTRQKFTQKERDSESGLDYFLARYYSSAQGRFTSVDAGRLNKRHLANPQKWNRYPYTINNPLKYIDPDGLEELIVIVNTFIPQKSTATFKGDGRNAGENGTYRTHQRIVIETDPSKNGGNPLVGKPERDTGVSKGIVPQGTNPSMGGVVFAPKEDKASGGSLGVDVTRNENGVVNIHAHGNESNPLAPSPGITYNFDIKVNSEGPQGSAEVTVTGKHDRFPGYEIIVQRPEAENNAPQMVYDFDPRKNGNTPMSLFPFTPKEYPNKTTPIPPKPQ